MNILGISCYFHDAAAALLCQGQLVAAAEEERFTRRKHDFSFPQQAIDFCLRSGGLSPQDLDYVAFFEKPFVKFERLLLSSLQAFPHAVGVFREAMVAWLGDKLWIKHRLERLGIPAERILFSDHHLSHAASAFFCSPYDAAAVMTVDGVGEWATATCGVGRGCDLRILEEIRFPHSLGLLYSAFTAFLGFEVNEGEYKVMGMAPFGTPRHADKVRRLVHADGDGGFRLDMGYFSFHRSTHRTFSQRFVDLFGPPRRPESAFLPPVRGAPPADQPGPHR
jgi:carbamoyltransferase